MIGKGIDFIDKKLKNKIILISSLFLVGLILSVAISNFIILVINRKELNFINFLPHIVIGSLINDKLHFLMFISISLLILMCIFLFLNWNNSETFASELDKITNNISTPKAVGQKQHGSATWLKKNEFDIAFSYNFIDPNNKVIKDLLKWGLEDKANIKKQLAEGNSSTED